MNRIWISRDSSIPVTGIGLRLREGPHTLAMTNKLFSLKCFLVLALATASTCMAATKISYDEIPKHLGRFGSLLAHRGFTVTTTDGKLHKGRGLEIYSDHLSIYRGKSHEDAPKSKVHAHRNQPSRTFLSPLRVHS